jgi:protein subunit release factor B
MMSAEEKTLTQRMDALGVREQDIEERFVRSSGAGGQKINKTSTCVMLHHRPSGVRVKCQSERSQARNRALARRILLDKIEAGIKGAQAAEQRQIARLRRQQRARSRRARLKMLAEKRQQAEKKALRAPVRADGYED